MSPTALRVCIDRQPPPRTKIERLALLNNSKWMAGDTLTMAFLDGDAGLQQRVQQGAGEWLNFARLNFTFGADAAIAMIRISFQQTGSWSYIGKQCLSVQAPMPTMNYGWLTPNSPEDEVKRVVLHEFGHALGCIHEHQSPAGGIQWDKEAVYGYYAGPPNFWSRDQVDVNIFQAYDATATSFTALDPSSIMMYPVPKELTTNSFEVGWNRELSDTDKRFINAMYPLLGAATPAVAPPG